jgi:hypothetical protein
VITKAESSPEWLPVLSTHTHQIAREAIADIADDVVRLDVGAYSAFPLCERALLFAYMHLHDPNGDWYDLALQFLDLAIEKVSSSSVGQSGFGLYGGITGVGLIIEHVLSIVESSLDNGSIERVDDPIDDIDALLVSALRKGRWHGHYDLVGGLVGIGVYFVNRLPRPSATEGIELVLTRLEELSTDLACGTTWFTRPDLVPPLQLNAYPGGYYNLGVAHGVPGIVQLLGQITSLGIEPERALSLLLRTTRWLFEQRHPPSAPYRFPNAIGLDGRIGNSRLGWCYGDLGIAGVLSFTASNLNREDWQREATDMVDHCLLLSGPDNGIADAGLCHGALGVAHILNRMYQSTRKPRYLDAAVSWFGQGLAMRVPGRGVGGFSAYAPEQNPIWAPDASFLSGSIGIALSLVCAVNPIEPRWDRMLLLS